METKSFPLYGSSIQIACDLVKYLETLRRSQDRKDRAVETIASASAQQKSADELCRLVNDAIEADVNKAIADLSTYGVYNVVISDFVPVGYYGQILTAYQSGMDSELQECSDVYFQSLENARSDADSSVTGLPFGIISNSLIGIGVYALQESSEIKKQQAKANADYYQRSHHLERIYESNISNLKSQHYALFATNMIDATITLYDHMAAVYLTELSKCSKFDDSCLNGITIQRSTELLKNLALMTSREETIKQALIACPFNTSVYVEAASKGLFDHDLLAIAKFLGIADNIVSSLEQRIYTDVELSPTMIVEQYKAYCIAMSIIKDSSTQSVLKSHFPNIEKKTLQKFKSFASILYGKSDGFTEEVCIKNFLRKYEAQFVQYKSDEDLSVLIQNCTCTTTDIECLISDFGMTDIVSQIAKVVRYEGMGGYPGILNHIKLSMAEFVEKVLSYADKQEEENKKRKAEEEEREFAEKAKKDAYWGKINFWDGLSTNLFIIVVCMMLPCFLGMAFLPPVAALIIVSLWFLVFVCSGVIKLILKFSKEPHEP